MTKRVYEYSKQQGIPSKEILAVLEKGGFHLSSHMSVLEPQHIEFLDKAFKKSPSEQPSEQKAQPKKQPEKAQPAKEGPVKTEPSKTEKMETTTPDKSEHKITPPSPKPQKDAPIEKQTFDRKPVMRNHYTARPVSNEPEPIPAIPASIVIESMAVSEAARQLKIPVAELIFTLLRWGVVAAKNQSIAEEVVSRLAEHYHAEQIKKASRSDTDSDKNIAVEKGTFVERLPVVAVLGHVDHGKTTLLDFIRKTRVASREKGGITQHLGAYQAHTPQGDIVFIDTPGHEAFSRMRRRGIKAADVVILVVAADDGVMPQTIEAIKQAKSMNVPIIVAVNKMDKVEVSRLEGIRRDLAQQDLLPEDWGGQTVVVPISAMKGTGIDQLLEMIMLQAQMLELRADISGGAKGYVLEALLEKGRGPVATLLLQHGKIKIGDYFVCGKTFGKINSLVDSAGRRLEEVGPSTPVRVAGFAELPEPGDLFEVASKEEHRKARAAEVAPRTNAAHGQTLGKKEGINIIIKTDTNSSKEAVVESVAKVAKKAKTGINIVSAAVGDVREGDVDLAATTGALIYCLHVKAEPNALLLARKENVTLHFYDIIYKFLEELEVYAKGQKEIPMKRVKTGEAVVRKVFDIKGLGVIAGCYVRDGYFNKDGTVIIWRGNHKVGEGKIKSLQRDKKVVKEVHAGFECGFLVHGFNEWVIDDRVECFIMVPEPTN